MKIFLIILICISIIFIFYLKIFCSFQYLSDTILALTAIIIFWYTLETYQIRKSSEEQTYKLKRPIVSFKLWTNEAQQFDTRLQLINQSDYPIAVRVKCNFKIDDENIDDVWPSYSGKEYWNLQYKEEKEGHFNILSIYQKSGKISSNKKDKIKSYKETYSRHKLSLIPVDLMTLPKLSLTLEIFSQNELGMFLYYPPVLYQYYFDKLTWIPTITSTEPFWKYDRKPIWAKI
jgi:hypothetical protein